jgi:hypothetical protein
MEESTMPVTISRRSLATRAVAATATVAAAVGGFALMSPSADAANSTLVSITKLSVHHVAATTANQLITVTGTGFDEDVITGVAIGGCTTAPTYVVASPTSLLLKTAADCAVGTAKVVTITDTSSNTAVSDPAATGGAMALDFVAAPSIATMSATVNPVTTENSSGVVYANQVVTASTKGGAVVRVTAGSTKFVNSTAYPLAATLSGVPLTKITMPASGDYFTGVLGAHVADAAPALKITSNGATKTFLYHVGGSTATAGTQDFQYAGVNITVAPVTMPLAGSALKITGAGFTAATTVTVGGVNCPVSTTPAVTATTLTCTPAAVAAAGVKTVTTTTSGVTSVVSATSSVTFLDQ